MRPERATYKDRAPEPNVPSRFTARPNQGSLTDAGRANGGYCQPFAQFGVLQNTVEAHIANIFSKLELPPASDDHRRVLAVLAHLRGPG